MALLKLPFKGWLIFEAFHCQHVATANFPLPEYAIDSSGVRNFTRSSPLSVDTCFTVSTGWEAQHCRGRNILKLRVANSSCKVILTVWYSGFLYTEYAIPRDSHQRSIGVDDEADVYKARRSLSERLARSHGTGSIEAGKAGGVEV